jgi:hypothetical protein
MPGSARIYVRFTTSTIEADQRTKEGRPAVDLLTFIACELSLSLLGYIGLCGTTLDHALARASDFSSFHEILGNRCHATRERAMVFSVVGTGMSEVGYGATISE